MLERWNIRENRWNHIPRLVSIKGFEALFLTLDGKVYQVFGYNDKSPFPNENRNVFYKPEQKEIKNFTVLIE
jgi:hypothetical protein